MTYIAPRSKAFAHLDRLTKWQHGQSAAPVTVEWDLSNVCSLGCQACHFAHTHVAGPLASSSKPSGYSDTGRFADVAMVTRALKEMRIAGVEAIVWSGGGEPTLHPQFREIVTAARRWGFQQGLYTLGGHVDDTFAWSLDALAWVVVSLDAPDAETYAAEKRVPSSRFDSACSGITALRRHVPVVGVSYLLHALNWHRTADMLALSRSLGATYATFRPAIHTSVHAPGVITSDRSWVTEAEAELEGLATQPDVELDVDRFIEYRDWQSHGYTQCHGVTLLTMVTPDGRVWICPNRRGLKGSELGNLTTDAFADIWAKHPGRWNVDRDCRAMCRLHLVNQSLVPVFRTQLHEAFV